MYLELKKDGFWQGISFRCFLPVKKILIDIIQQALPASLNMLSIAAGAFIITYFVGQFGQNAIAAYGASMRIEQIILIPTVGLNSAMMTLAGQNNGAGKFERIKEAWEYSMKVGGGMMLLGGVLIFFGSKYLLAIFSQDPNVLEMGGLYLSFASFTLFGYVIMFCTGSMLQGLKKPRFALGTNLLRQILLPILLFPFFSNVWGIKGLWICILSIVWIAALISFGYGQYYLRKLVS